MCRKGKGIQRTATVCTMGGVVEDGGKGKIRYDGGSRKCVLVRDGMGVEELRSLLREIFGDGVVVKRLWYSLKYNRNMM